jgi:transposase-like protein
MEKTKRLRFPTEVILVCFRWYTSYPLSYWHIEAMMEERSVVVDHSSINRWSIRFPPIFEKIFRKYNRVVVQVGA